MDAIKETIRQSFIDGGFFAKDDIVLENGSFSTQGREEPFAEIVFSPANVKQETLDGVINRVDGVVSINLSYPLNSRADASENKAREIVGYYAPGKSFAYEEQEIAIAAPVTIGESFPYMGWFVTQISITYYAFTGGY